MEPDPLVSIVIPTFVRPILLRRAIESALQQSYTNIEVIVVDDSAGCEGIAACRSIRDPRLRAHRNHRSRGACGARNSGIELARGMFYTGLDDDDYFHKYRVDVLLTSYYSELSFVASNILQIRSGSAAPRFRGQKTISLDDILWGNCVGNQIFSELYKVRAIGAFDEHLSAGQDFDLWIRMIERWGPALRLAPCLYTMDLGHGTPRIGTTVGVSRRVNDFLDRHGEKLSTAQRMLHSMRVRKHNNGSYLGLAIASLCIPATWRYWIKRARRAW